MNRPTISDRLLGLSKAETRAPNTYSVFQYLMIFGVIALGMIYAAPNLYPPDYAVQIRAEAADATIDASVLERATQVLAAADIEVRGTESSEKEALIRLTSNDDQLRGRELINAEVNPEGKESYVVALNLASTTPQWMRSIGAHPMSYGLDLSGGVHFLLEVDMDKAVADRMTAEEENIRRILRDANLRYAPSPNWVEGTRIAIAFVDATTRDAGKDAIEKELRDYTVLARDVNGRPGLSLTLKETLLHDIQDY